MADIVKENSNKGGKEGLRRKLVGLGLFSVSVRRVSV